jgi:hypothetical protein
MAGIPLWSARLVMTLSHAGSQCNARTGVRKSSILAAPYARLLRNLK